MMLSSRRSKLALTPKLRAASDVSCDNRKLTTCDYVKLTTLIRYYGLTLRVKMTYHPCNVG